MKLSIVIAGENAMPSSFSVMKGFEDSINKAADFGYHGVELALKSASDINPVLLTKWLSRKNMEVSCISTGQVFSELGLYFTNSDYEKRKKVIEVFKGFVNLAGEFGKIINIGRARGFIASNQTRAECIRLFLDSLKVVYEEAVKKDVTLIIEPVNRYEINFINNLDQGTEVIERSNLPNLGLMPDVFHMNIEDDRIGDSLIRNSRYIKYIHLADSNRLAPGKGHLDFNDVFSALIKMHYNGWVSVEILPKPDPLSAAQEAANYLKPFII